MDKEGRNRARPDNSFRIVAYFCDSANDSRSPQSIATGFDKRLLAAFILKGQFEIFGKFFLERKYVADFDSIVLNQRTSAFLAFFFPGIKMPRMRRSFD